MPKYKFCLQETSTVYEEVEADNLEDAYQMIDDLLYYGDFDWSKGKMEERYEFTGDVHFDESSV